MAWLIGLLVAVSLGVATIALGVALASYDQRRHIPGHFLHYALVMAPGLVQLVYLVPLYRLCCHQTIIGLAMAIDE